MGDAVQRLRHEGITGVATLTDLIAELDPPRVVWLMVPAALTQAVVVELESLLSADDIVVDGGNSYYRDDIARAERLAGNGIHYLDVGTSGGVHGFDRGFCLMIGGDAEAVAVLDPIFLALAAGPESVTRTPGRAGAFAQAEYGYVHCGAAGAGHFVKMVHNGVEYGQMAVLAEGMAILRNADIGAVERSANAETAPLADAEFYRYDFDIASILETWRRGSVISSWLLDLTATAVTRSPELGEYSGHVADSGEGRWTVRAAIDEGVPAHVLAAALWERFDSRGGAEYANKALSAMRSEFGSHNESAAR